ncbi:hypothetical protein MA16_Dca006370 [Dendrobium catenatum]|uniref:Uncharacterized protein n=1 Tax=Dendrobium catenatum TaxID=906689 RepID=A0A2I0X7K0_9ASPA|nr:hypothetical protein MA16_Dca006370 [Dendrobium catenatum]
MPKLLRRSPDTCKRLKTEENMQCKRQWNNKFSMIFFLMILLPGNQATSTFLALLLSALHVESAEKVK